MLVLLLILSRESLSQPPRSEVLDERWKLTADRKHAIVPLSSLIKGAAKIATLDERKEAYKADAISRAKQIDALEKAFDARGEELENTKGQNKQLLHELGVVNARANTVERKVKKRRKWTFIAIGGILYAGGEAYFNHIR